MAMTPQQQQAYYQSRALPVPSPAKKPLSAQDAYPYGPSPAQTGNAAYHASNGTALDNYLGIVAQGPDYSQIPKGFGSAGAQQIAQAQVTDLYRPMEANYARDQKYQNDQRAQALQAGTNFTAALAGILTGGLSGQEGMDYAKKTFGGSFLGEIATKDGQKLFLDITHDFDAKDYALLQKIDAAREKQPELAYQIYQDVMKQEQENIQNGIKTADNSYQARMKAALVVLAEEKSRREALTKVLVAREKAGQKSPVNLQIKYAGTKAFQYDPRTGTTVRTPELDKPTKAAPAPKYWHHDGVVQRINPDGTLTTTDTYTPTTKSGSKKPTPSTVSNTVKRATDSGNAVLDQVLANIAAKFPAPDPKSPDFADAQAAYRAYLDNGSSFKTAMTRVIKAMYPHLKTLGYSQSRIRKMAYQIVSLQMQPPPGYKVP
jgi:hypothetical protein